MSPHIRGASEPEVRQPRPYGYAMRSCSLSFADVVRYLDAPVLALRALKSDPVVGVPAVVAARLDGADSGWRTSGRYGVVQFAGGG
ncbi:MAG: hypothetical protein JXQ72_03320 [Anaerolineae bacterium]|nr:hypothetical protein [Anaerolineae bacterium]